MKLVKVCNGFSGSPPMCLCGAPDKRKMSSNLKKRRIQGENLPTAAPVHHPSISIQGVGIGV